jgi:hypothetical protein
MAVLRRRARGAAAKAGAGPAPRSLRGGRLRRGRAGAVAAAARQGKRKRAWAPRAPGTRVRDAACPVSTGGGTRRVQLVREGEGGRAWAPASRMATFWGRPAPFCPRDPSRGGQLSGLRSGRAATRARCAGTATARQLAQRTVPLRRSPARDMRPRRYSAAGARPSPRSRPRLAPPSVAGVRATVSEPPPPPPLSPNPRR